MLWCCFLTLSGTWPEPHFESWVSKRTLDPRGQAERNVNTQAAGKAMALRLVGLVWMSGTGHQQKSGRRWRCHEPGSLCVTRVWGNRHVRSEYLGSVRFHQGLSWLLSVLTHPPCCCPTFLYNSSFLAISTTELSLVAQQPHLTGSANIWKRRAIQSDVWWGKNHSGTRQALSCHSTFLVWETNSFVPEIVSKTV